MFNWKISPSYARKILGSRYFEQGNPEELIIGRVKISYQGVTLYPNSLDPDNPESLYAYSLVQQTPPNLYLIKYSKKGLRMGSDVLKTSGLVSINNILSDLGKGVKEIQFIPPDISKGVFASFTITPQKIGSISRLLITSTMPSGLSMLNVSIMLDTGLLFEILKKTYSLEKQGAQQAYRYLWGNVEKNYLFSKMSGGGWFGENSRIYGFGPMSVRLNLSFDASTGEVDIVSFELYSYDGIIRKTITYEQLKNMEIVTLS